jgi:hypothetical protein
MFGQFEICLQKRPFKSRIMQTIACEYFYNPKCGGVFRRLFWTADIFVRVKMNSNQQSQLGNHALITNIRPFIGGEK